MEIGPGDVLSHFRVLGKVGEGGMGVVYRARDLHLERDVALKVLSSSRAASEASERRFRKEALALSRLNHPNIASIFDFDSSGGVTFLVMEWIPGATLDRKLADGPLSERTVLELGDQISAALAYAHSEGIIHRDLKPANLGLGADGRVKVLDFGLAKLWKPSSDGSLTETMPRMSVLVGTLPYVAPELFTGAVASNASDIYSLGAVLYELATARRAFPQSDSEAMMAAILHELPPPPRSLNPKISEDLERVILRCLEKVPSNRYESAFEVRSDLRRVADGLPLASIPRWRVSRRTARLGLAAAVITGAIALGLFSSGRPPRATPFMKALATSAANESAPEISPDREWISYVSDSSGVETISLQRVKGGDARPLVSEKGISSSLWSPDGERIAFLVARVSETVLRIVPAFGGGAETTFPMPQEFRDAHLVRWIGSNLYVEDRGRALCRINVRDGQVTQVTSSVLPEGLRCYYDVRNDEKEIVWTLLKEEAASLWTSAPDGGGARSHTLGSYNDFAARYAVNGGVLYCSSDRAGQADLWRVPIDGSDAQQITSSANIEYVGGVADDESLVTFTEMREGANVWRWDRRSGEHRQLTADALRHVFLAFAPQARRIAVQREKPAMEWQKGLFNADLMTASYTGGRLHGSWTHIGEGGGAQLSPDGQRIVFVRAAGENLELRLRDLRSAQEWRLTPNYKRSRYYPFPNDWNRIHYAWSPDSRALWFHRQVEKGSEEIAIWYEGDIRTVYRAEAGVAVSDFHPSGDGRLAFVTSPQSMAGESAIHVLGPAGDSVRYSMKHELVGKVFLRGWLDTESLVAVDAPWNEDWTERATIFLIGPNGRRDVATVPKTYAGTARFDRATATLFLTAVGESGAHNLVAIRLADGAVIPVTNNDLPGFSYASIETGDGGDLLYVRQESNQDIWTVRFTRP